MCQPFMTMNVVNILIVYGWELKLDFSIWPCAAALALWELFTSVKTQFCFLFFYQKNIYIKHVHYKSLSHTHSRIHL